MLRNISIYKKWLERRWFAYWENLFRRYESRGKYEGEQFCLGIFMSISIKSLRNVERGQVCFSVIIKYLRPRTWDEDHWITVRSTRLKSILAITQWFSLPEKRMQPMEDESCKYFLKLVWQKFRKTALTRNHSLRLPVRHGSRYSALQRTKCSLPLCSWQKLVPNLYEAGVGCGS